MDEKITHQDQREGGIYRVSIDGKSASRNQITGLLQIDSHPKAVTETDQTVGKECQPRQAYENTTSSKDRVAEKYNSYDGKIEGICYDQVDHQEGKR